MLSRRSLIRTGGITAGVGALAMVSAPAAEAGPIADGLLIRSFCAAWVHLDPDLLAAYFSDDAVYQNIPIPNVFVGKTAIRDELAIQINSIEYTTLDIVHQVSLGGRVMNERIDTFRFVGGDHDVHLPIMGSFTVDNNKITSWYDYFDLAQSGYGGP